MDLIVEFVSRNLVTQVNFVEFRDSKNFTFFEATGDTWHAKEMHVSHMASHLSTCMSMEKFIKGEGDQFVKEESNKKERKEKKRREKKKRKRKRKRRKGERKRGKRKSVFRRLELV